MQGIELQGEGEEEPRLCLGLRSACPCPVKEPKSRRGEGTRAHLAARSCSNGPREQLALPVGLPPIPCPSWDTACPRTPSSRLSISRALSEHIGDLAERRPIFGAGGPAALHQPVQLGRAALGLREPCLPSLQVC